MIGLLCLFFAFLASSFKSKCRREAENAVLRHQLIVLRRKVHGRVRLTNNDHWLFIELYPSILQVLTIIRPDTLVRWHRAGFRRYWRWKWRSIGVRPQIETDLRVLILRMSIEKPPLQWPTFPSPRTPLPWRTGLGSGLRDSSARNRAQEDR